MRFVFISDVHEQWHGIKIPKCDILISSGDYSYRGKPEVVKNFHAWLDEQDADHIVSVQGNHEMWVEKNFALAKEIALKECPRVHFIDEGLAEVGPYKIWGSAITPWFHDWAWNRNRGADCKKHWDLIPDGVDVIVTHGPPMGILDIVRPYTTDPLGCYDLKQAVDRIKPKVHAFGHIHDGYGVFDNGTTKFVNASICTERYDPFNEPIVVDIV